MNNSSPVLIARVVSIYHTQLKMTVESYLCAFLLLILVCYAYWRRPWVSPEGGVTGSRFDSTSICLHLPTSEVLSNEQSQTLQSMLLRGQEIRSYIRVVYEQARCSPRGIRENERPLISISKGKCKLGKLKGCGCGGMGSGSLAFLGANASIHLINHQGHLWLDVDLKLTSRARVEHALLRISTRAEEDVFIPLYSARGIS